MTCVAFSIKFAKTNQKLKFAENSEFCEKITIIQNYSLHSLGTGAWIYWEVDAEVNVECVEVVVYCTSEQPKKFVLHRGKVGEVQQSPAFGSRGVPFTDPGKPKDTSE